MKIVAGLAAFLATTTAQALDCAALKTTTVPFAMDYRLERVATGRPPLPTAQRRVQVFRGPSETSTYLVSGAGPSTRTRTKYELFPIDITSNGEVRRWRYSIDTSVDPMIARKPLSYHADLLASDGKVVISADMSLAFAGNATMELEGCRFDVTKIERTLTGASDGKPLSYTTELWFSPELRTSLLTRLQAGDQTTTYTAAAITLEFERVDEQR